MWQKETIFYFTHLTRVQNPQSLLYFLYISVSSTEKRMQMVQPDFFPDEKFAFHNNDKQHTMNDFKRLLKPKIYQ